MNSVNNDFAGDLFEKSLGAFSQVYFVRSISLKIDSNDLSVL